MSYKTIKGPRGSVRYMKDGKMISKNSIPQDILIKLEVGMNDVSNIEVENIHKCIFCGQVTKQYRLLDQQAIYICQDDYYDKTMGQIAKQVKQKELVNA